MYFLWGIKSEIMYLCRQFGEKSEQTYKHSLLFRVQPRSLANYLWYNKTRIICDQWLVQSPASSRYSNAQRLGVVQTVGG